MALKRPFSELDWQLTPAPVRQYVMALERMLFDMEQRIVAHEKRLEKLEVRTKRNSHNSSKPPSSDPPFSRKKRKQKKSKRSKGGQKGHKANQQQMLDPTERYWLMPRRCSCGHTGFDQEHMQPFYVHQHIEIPEIEMQISHYILQQCDCPNCGKTVKATLPTDVSTGYGPRFTAFIGELSGIKAMSRNDVKQLCESVLGIGIATGTIQKLVDRTSNALCRHTSASAGSPDVFGATTSTKRPGSRKTACTGCGPWSTNGWRFIASTRIVPKRLSKNWSGIGTGFWSATVTAYTENG